MSLERVDLFIKANGLPKIPTFSNTDPFAVVFMRDPRTEQFIVIGTTVSSTLRIDYLIYTFMCLAGSK